MVALELYKAGTDLMTTLVQLFDSDMDSECRGARFRWFVCSKGEYSFL
jgi:hypothetical protein